MTRRYRSSRRPGSWSLQLPYYKHRSSNISYYGAFVATASKTITVGR